MNVGGFDPFCLELIQMKILVLEAYVTSAVAKSKWIHSKWPTKGRHLFFSPSWDRRYVTLPSTAMVMTSRPFKGGSSGTRMVAVAVSETPWWSLPCPRHLPLRFWASTSGHALLRMETGTQDRHVLPSDHCLAVQAILYTMKKSQPHPLSIKLERGGGGGCMNIFGAPVHGGPNVPSRSCWPKNCGGGPSHI